jgi:hypothetical protein
MKTVSALIFTAVACLVAAAVLNIRHDNYLTGSQLIG